MQQESLKRYLDNSIALTKDRIIAKLQAKMDVKEDKFYLAILEHIKEICIQRNKH